MLRSRSLSALCAVFLLVQTVGAQPPLPDDRAIADAERLWQQGQEAMVNRLPDEAIARYQASLARNPCLVRNYLSLAAAYVEKGDESMACRWLLRYVESNPGHLVARSHLAELFLRQDRLEDARRQFEACVARAQEAGADEIESLVHCHVRLMEIASRAADDYGEHLHRGIGLWLMARQRAALPDPDEGSLPTEGLLCQSAGELTLARQERPGEARAAWYLYQVWSQLDQVAPARKALRAAYVAAPFSELTPSEQRSLHLMVSQNHLAQLTR